MATTVAAIDAIIDHITSAEHIWEPSQFVNNRKVTGFTDDNVEFTLTYSYQLGTCYMTGPIGSEGETVEMLYRINSGFQFVFKLDGKETFADAYPPHRTQEVKLMLAHRASL